MSNYPPGSMAGSGIYAEERSMPMQCAAPIEPDHEDDHSPDECDFHDAVDVHIDDYGVLTWECPQCGAEHEEERADL